jgi:ribosomal protein L37E
MSLLDRFRRIERSRREAPVPAGDPDTAGRIEGVERPLAGPTHPAASGADLDRFAPPPPAPVELVPADADRRPFTRCLRCGMDHHALASECAGCGAALDTPEQRAFNDGLWAERRAERAEEERLHAEREVERLRAAAELAVERRAAAESLAREVGERERRRLQAGGFEGGMDEALGLIVLWTASGLAAAARWIRRMLGRGADPG